MTLKAELRMVVLALVCMGILVSVFLGKSEGRRKAAFLAAWLVPGLGHVILGRWKKGLFFFSILGVTYLVGMWIVGFRPVSWDDNPFYYIGQYGSGITFVVAKALSAEKAFPREGVPLSWFDPGLLYVCVVGLLNLVIMTHVLDVKPSSAPQPEGAAPAPVAASPPEAKP